jgi:hypothetical protein
MTNFLFEDRIGLLGLDIGNSKLNIFLRSYDAVSHHAEVRLPNDCPAQNIVDLLQIISKINSTDRIQLHLCKS